MLVPQSEMLFCRDDFLFFECCTFSYCLPQLSYLTRCFPLFHKPHLHFHTQEQFRFLRNAYYSASIFLLTAYLLHLAMSSMRSGTTCLWYSWSLTESMRTVGFQQPVIEWRCAWGGGYMMMNMLHICHLQCSRIERQNWKSGLNPDYRSTR